MSEAVGKTGILHFDGSMVRVAPKGIASAVRGKREVRLPLTSVHHVEWKNASLMDNGYIRMNTGDADIKGEFGTPASTIAVQDGNSIVFARSQQSAFEAIRDEIEQALAGPTKVAAAPVAAVDGADQLRRLAELRDQGVLSDEEFAAKKSEILSRM